MVTFLMIARILYDKGFQQYVDAAKEIKCQYPNTRFLLLGDVDPQYPNHVPISEVNKYVSQGVIEYLGYRSDVITVIKEADCIVHPSYYNEGMSRVLMEALALKKPIITTNIPGCREFVIQNQNGYICEPKNTESLIYVLHNFLTLTRDQIVHMGEVSRKLAEERYNIGVVIQIYKEIVRCM